MESLKEQPAASAANILLVDDQPANLLALEAILSDLGQTLVKARSGEEALRLLLRNDFAVVLLDLAMPGLDGFQTAQLIRGRERSRHTPIIFLTGHDRNDFPVDLAYQLGAVDYLVKPLIPVILRAKVAVFVDLFRKAELRRRAEQLAEANRQKDEFLAMLAHELRNPLAPIRNAVQLLNLRPDDPAVVAQARDIISRQTEQLTRLVDELLDASRIARGKVQLKPERIDLAALVKAVTGDQRAEFEAARLTLAVDVPDAPLWVRGDAARLTQVVGNLLNNALKFTDPIGRVALLLQEEGGSAYLSVEDTGVGIAPEALPRLFEAFSQVDATLERSKGGLGLGLAVIKGLVELHGGHVSATSEGANRGARFTVWLPLDDTEVVPAPAVAALVPQSAGGRRRKILIIEDGRDAAESLRLLLSLRGFEVAVAYAGPDGLEQAHRFVPDAVICDLGLPGMSGYEVARALRADTATASALLVCVSGYGQPGDQKLAREAGFDEVLVKPAEPSLLVRLLETKTGPHRTDAEPVTS